MSSYSLELDRWNIKNDGTNAQSTSIGINNALVWANQNDFTEVIFPKGTYLIDENNPIRPTSYMTINLNGSTLKINDNSLSKYAVVKVDSNQIFITIKNGYILGDRITHDYSKHPTNEWGYGIELNGNVRNITLTDLDISNCTGDAVALESIFGQLPGSKYNINGTWEQGSLNLSNGVPVGDSSKVRSTLKIDLNHPLINKWKYFGLYGDSYGGVGKEITTNSYDVYFYKSDDSFLFTKQANEFFDELEVPQESAYARIVLNQMNVPSLGGSSITLRVPEFPQRIHLVKNNLHHCRRQGISVLGAKNIFIKNNEIHHIKGAAPQGGIDIEDGYDLNQNIHIVENQFHDNNGFDIISISGKRITVSSNKITKTLYVNAGVSNAIISDNIFNNAEVILGGECRFSNNDLIGTKVTLPSSAKEKNITITNCSFYNSTLGIGKSKPYSFYLSDCNFNLDADFKIASSILGFSAEPQTISSCTFKGEYSITSYTNVPPGSKNGWLMEDVSFNNTRHQKNYVTALPPGKYNNCNFFNTGTMRLAENSTWAEYQFRGCNFEWDNYNLFNITQNITCLRYNSCYFKGNKWGSALFIWNKVNRLSLVDNYFNYPISDSTDNIINLWNTFSTDHAVFAGNHFTSNKPMIAVNASGINEKIVLVFRDNDLSNVITKLKNTHITLNNLYNSKLQ